MANKLHPDHMVALMSYIFPTKQACSSGSIDPPSFNPQHCITKQGQTSVRAFPIMDAIASICAFKGGSQAVAEVLQLNPQKEAITLTLAANEQFEPCLVDHLQSVGGNLGTVSNEFTTQGRLDQIQDELRNIYQDLAWVLMLKIFLELYELRLDKQRRREQKWLDNLQRFANKLAKCGKGILRVQGIELDLNKIVTGFNMAEELVDKLRHYLSYRLTDDEWLEV